MFRNSSAGNLSFHRNCDGILLVILDSGLGFYGVHVPDRNRCHPYGCDCTR